MNTNLTFETIQYGQLVELAGLTEGGERSFEKSGGYHAGVKVHFFNEKGVLVGNMYEFVPYKSIRMRPDGCVWERKHFGKPLEVIRNLAYELTCRLVSFLIRVTQKGL